ncbi:MAG: C-type lectin domain-containing protein [Verrucomicrobiales bacterium]|nr:C-type lectin domain-containing protein [Verrucomicrobiales bacterium]
MKQATVLLLSVITFQIAVGQNLPKESRELLNKLKEFEEKTYSEADSFIAEKRKQVLQVLETHMSEATKQGNLEAALAVREEIASLKIGLPTEKSAPPEIPKDAIYFEGSYYKFITKPVNWITASFECQKMGGHLAEIMDQKTYDFLIEKSSGEEFYFGLYLDTLSETYLGTVSKKTPPKEFLPYNPGRERSFLRINGDKKLEAGLGNFPRPFFCQWPAG